MLTLLAACAHRAGEPTTPPPGHYQPMPRAGLVERTDLQFLVASSPGHTDSRTWLARRAPDGRIQPLAWIHTQAGLGERQVSVHLLPEPSVGHERHSLTKATLEQLYALVFRLPPQASFCLTEGPAPCASAASTPHGPSASGQPKHAQAELLTALAERRAQIAAQVPGSRPWQVVTLRPGPGPAWDPDLVSVRAQGAQGPKADLAVYFDRPPHAICMARSGPGGEARCRLQDQHDDSHLHDHSVPVLATFPGEIHPDRVLLPTTQLLPGLVRTAATPFAQPWAWPLPRR